MVINGGISTDEVTVGKEIRKQFIRVVAISIRDPKTRAQISRIVSLPYKVILPFRSLIRFLLVSFRLFSVLLSGVATVDKYFRNKTPPRRLKHLFSHACGRFNVFIFYVKKDQVR